MGIIAKSKLKSSSGTANTTHNTDSKSYERWGMGLLLVFVPEDNNPTSSTATTTGPPPSSSPNSCSSRVIKRTNSNNPILTKTRSTISICILLLFLTLLLFTLSTFEPSIPTPTTIKSSRRFLSQKGPPNSKLSNPTSIKVSGNNFPWFERMWASKDTKRSEISSFALQGMGKLYRRGTRAMSDLLVGHVVEDTNEDEFRLFLRLLHWSGLTAKADVVFIVGSSSFASRFEEIIQEENDSFFKLLHRSTGSNFTSQESGFDLTQFVKNGKKEPGEPLWGKKIRGTAPPNSYNESAQSHGELTRLSYGSVVSFEADELDPENSLAGFLDHVAMSMRRWACYPMLLGRVRRNFKHVMLMDVKKLVLFGDPLGRVRNRNPESVYISGRPETSSSKHGRRSPEKSQSHWQVNAGIVMGGARGVRRLSNAMLTEIVRVSMQHKKKTSVTESGVLSELVGNGHLLKNIDLITSTEAIPGTRPLIGSHLFL